MADFHEKRPLGQTGLMVSRLGIGSSFGASSKVIEDAFDRGVNYLYWGSIRRPGFGRAMRNLAKRARDELVLTVQSYSRLPSLVAPSVDVALRRTGLEYFDLLLLGMRNARPSDDYHEAFERLRDAGKVRHLAISTHNRPLLPSLFAEYQEGRSPYEVFMFRYNAVHRGAENDVLPFIPRERTPGIITYTSTRWGHLLDPKKMPPGESPVAASDCYRFALTRDEVDVALCGPADKTQMDEALRALDRGPLDEAEMARICGIGDFIYGKYSPQFVDRGDAKDEDPEEAPTG
jgi:aryl-alcohol dehydrogenase-like predicted oxidoreductase